MNSLMISLMNRAFSSFCLLYFKSSGIIWKSEVYMTNYIYQRKNSKNSNLKIFEYTTKCQNNTHMRILVL